jgi:hypothetical protein
VFNGEGGVTVKERQFEWLWIAARDWVQAHGLEVMFYGLVSAVVVLAGKNLWRSWRDEE